MTDSLYMILGFVLTAKSVMKSIMINMITVQIADRLLIGVKKMGQHKHNPTAIAAKTGEIKPKKRVTKSQQKRAIEVAAKSALYNLFPFSFNSKYID